MLDSFSNNSPASGQSKQFQLSQKKRFQEGLANNITSSSKQVLRETDASSQEQIVTGLKQQYNDTLAEYQGLLTKATENATSYFNRIGPKNPYSNKTVQFTTGELAYVTNNGVLKYISSTDILNSLGVSKKPVQLGIPWDRAYLIPQTQITSTPPLISGTPMKMGQSVGNEGSNVYVDKLVSNSNATYQGCFTDDTAKPSMTFLTGGTPSTVSSMINGYFSQPIIAKNSYQYMTSVIAGWDFNATLLNESADWGFPIPYPNGSQCACLQNDQSISQTLILSSGAYKLSFVACGRNCCDNSNSSNPVEVLLNDTVVYKVDPLVNVWTNYETRINVVTTGNNTIKFRGTWTTTDRSTAIQSVSIDVDGSTSTGIYTYEDCKSAAIEGGFSFFSLQHVNYTSGKGFCAVSNNDVAAKKRGNSYRMTDGIPLWSSNTAGQNTATLTNDGTLVVLNSSGSSVYSTPAKKPTDYMGCYSDKANTIVRNMFGQPIHSWVSGKVEMNIHQTMETPGAKGEHKYDLAACKQLSEDKGLKYYSLQDSKNGENGMCELSNDLSKIKKYGITTNCERLKNGYWVGGHLSNAVYTLDPDEVDNYFLILQDDGNMCIFRGSSPTNNSGLIWSSGSTGKQKDPNLNFTAKKSKYGKNWISAGSTLASGDFVSSNNGSIYLVMQSDGNLILYTSRRVLNCDKIPDNKMGGGVGANALYKLDETGFKSNLSKLGYVNPNADVYTYPSDNLSPGDNFTEHLGYDSVGHDIQGASYGDATLDKCKSSCLNDATCAGFAYTPENNVCYPKNEIGSKTLNKSSNLYVRSHKPKTLPTGVSSKINNVDSIKYQNYASSGNAIDNSYGFNSVNQQQLDQAKAKMDLLSNQLINSTGNYSSGDNAVNQRISANIKAVEGFTNSGYLTQLNDTRKRINEIDKTTYKIVNNSEIVSLQRNYEYILWSILAIGTVIISMNVVRK
jgi:hypothetical protein